MKFITPVGNDTYGQKAIQFYCDEGLSVSMSKVCDQAPTGITTIWVDKKGENGIITIPGINPIMVASDHVKIIQTEIVLADFISSLFARYLSIQFLVMLSFAFLNQVKRASCISYSTTLSHF